MTRRPPFRCAALAVTLGLAALAFAEDQSDSTLSAGDFTLKRADATAFAEPAPAASPIPLRFPARARLLHSQDASILAGVDFSYEHQRQA